MTGRKDCSRARTFDSLQSKGKRASQSGQKVGLRYFFSLVYGALLLFAVVPKERKDFSKKRTGFKPEEGLGRKLLMRWRFHTRLETPFQMPKIAFPISSVCFRNWLYAFLKEFRQAKGEKGLLWAKMKKRLNKKEEYWKMVRNKAFLFF